MCAGKGAGVDLAIALFLQERMSCAGFDSTYSWEDFRFVPKPVIMGSQGFLRSYVLLFRLSTGYTEFVRSTTTYY